MDVLTEKSVKSYDNYISRYANFLYYYHTLDKKYVYGVTAQLKKDIEYVKIKVEPTMTLDSLANKYYGRPDYFWIIADFNNIQDPFIDLYEYFNYINIPSFTSIEFED